MTEDEMAGWHHWLDEPESEWTPGVGDGQGGLACCDSWGHKESDMTKQLNWTERKLWGNIVFFKKVNVNKYSNKQVYKQTLIVKLILIKGVKAI